MHRFNVWILATTLLALPASAATITIVNADSAGEGLNDATVVAPVGGNSGTTLGAQRLIAMQHAASIWGGILSSNVEIRVEARLDPLSCNISEADLGSGGPTHLFTLTVPGSVPDTWYPAALGDSLLGSNANVTLRDIAMTFNSSVGTVCPFPMGWYYGLDGAGNDGTELDFVTAVLRELAHGLGFTTFVDVTTGAEFAGKSDIFENFLLDLSTGKTWDEMDDSERLASVIDSGDLLWTGIHVTDSIGILSSGTAAGYVQMHAPATAEPGVSVIHWDPSVSPDQLVEPAADTAIHDPGLARGLMADIGWVLATCGNGTEDIGEICEATECCTASCTHAEFGTTCDDGEFCNGTETCDAGGGCTGASTGDPCPGPDGDSDCSEECNEGADACTANDADAEVCDDIDICTPTSSCSAGACVGVGYVCAIDPYILYSGRAPKQDALGQDLAAELPKPWVLQLDDLHLADSAEDDPENFEVRKPTSMLNPAYLGASLTLVDPDLRYLRYAMKPGKQGAGNTLPSGAFPKAVKHEPRVWKLSNSLGTIHVRSSKVAGFLLPATIDDSVTPLPPADDTHFVCYQVKATKDVTDQTPNAGDGEGSFRGDLQVFVADEFDDCALDSDGNPAFAGSSVEGRCLVDLKKVRELCSPVNTSAVEDGRTTEADFVGTNLAQTTETLLCYQPKLAGMVESAAAAALAGVPVGTRVSPKQSSHIRHSIKTGNPLFAAPGSDFDAPELVETSKLGMVCLPSIVTSVE